MSLTPRHNELEPPADPEQVNGRYLRHFADRLAAVLVSGARADYELGRMVDEVIRGTYFRKWPGKQFSSLGDWCWEVLHFREGKARAHHRIYTKLGAMGIAEDSLTLSRVLRVGWSKLHLVLQVARTEIQLTEWIDRIEQNNMTETTLRYEIAQTKTGLEEPAPRGVVPAGPAPVPDDEEPAAKPKGKKGKKGEGLPADLPDLGSPSEGANPPADPPRRFHKLQLVFEDAESMRIWKDALNVVKKRYQYTGDGKAAALMATHYLGACPRDDEGGAPIELEKLLGMVEATYGIKVTVSGDTTTSGRSRSTKDQASTF